MVIVVDGDTGQQVCCLRWIIIEVSRRFFRWGDVEQRLMGDKVIVVLVVIVEQCVCVDWIENKKWSIDRQNERTMEKRKGKKLFREEKGESGTPLDWKRDILLRSPPWPFVRSLTPSDYFSVHLSWKLQSGTIFVFKTIKIAVASWHANNQRDWSSAANQLRVVHLQIAIERFQRCNWPRQLKGRRDMEIIIIIIIDGRKTTWERCWSHTRKRREIAEVEIIFMVILR